MTESILTAKEAKWVRKLQAVLNECPSDRIGAYVTGDPNIELFDKTKEAEINKRLDGADRDFCQAVDEEDAHLGTLITPFAVYSTCG